MPPVIAAVAVALDVSLTVAEIIVTALEIGASMVISSALTPKPKSNSAVAGPLPFSMMNGEPRIWGYGRMATSGVVKYWETLGTKNEDLWFVVAVHDTPCEAFEAFISENTTISFTANAATNKYVIGGTPYMWRWDKLGGESQTVEANLDAASTKWTSAHRLQGVAYYVLKMKHDPTVYSLGIPTPLLVVKSRKLWDPRKDVNYGGTGSHLLADETTWEWTTNPSLCLLDYLKGVNINGKRIGGCGVPIAQINVPSFVAAANTCDEAVGLAAGGTEPRYTCNGSANSIEDKGTVVEALLLAMMGTLCVRGGQLYLIAGAAQVSVMTLTDDDLAGELIINPSSARQDKINSLTCAFADPAQNYAAVPGPPLTIPQYVTDDGGVTLSREVAHRFTTSVPTVSRLNKLALSNFREQLSFQARFKPKAVEVSAGDTFDWSSNIWVDPLSIELREDGTRELREDGASFELREQYFGGGPIKMICLSRTLLPDGTVDITARQETDLKYFWATSEELAPPSFDPGPNAGLPPLLAAPAGLAAAQSGTVATITWTELVSTYLAGYNVYTAPGSGASFGSATKIVNIFRGNAYPASLAIGSYTVFVVAVDTFGRLGTVSAGINFSMTAAGIAAVSLFNIITSLGLTTNLKLCLDSGDVSSYSGTGQTWSDTSGTGTDFYRGTTSGAEASDPTFNGVAGDFRATTNWSEDGGDKFTLTTANPAWVDALHKAGGAFTVLVIFKYGGTYDPDIVTPGNGVEATLLASTVSPNPIGIEVYAHYDPGASAPAAGAFGFRVQASSHAAAQNSRGIDTAAGWYVGIVSINDALTGNAILVNGSNYTNIDGRYGTPSAAAANATLALGPMLNLDRVLGVAVWNTNLSSDNLSALYSAIRFRRGDLALP